MSVVVGLSYYYDINNKQVADTVHCNSNTVTDAVKKFIETENVQGIISNSRQANQIH